MTAPDTTAPADGPDPAAGEVEVFDQTPDHPPGAKVEEYDWDPMPPAVGATAVERATLSARPRATIVLRFDKKSMKFNATVEGRKDLYVVGESARTVLAACRARLAAVAAGVEWKEYLYVRFTPSDFGTKFGSGLRVTRARAGVAPWGPVWQQWHKGNDDWGPVRPGTPPVGDVPADYATNQLGDYAAVLLDPSAGAEYELGGIDEAASALRAVLAGAVRGAVLAAATPDGRPRLTGLADWLRLVTRGVTAILPAPLPPPAPPAPPTPRRSRRPAV